MHSPSSLSVLGIQVQQLSAFSWKAVGFCFLFYISVIAMSHVIISSGKLTLHSCKNDSEKGK